MRAVAQIKAEIAKLEREFGAPDSNMSPSAFAAQSDTLGYEHRLALEDAAERAELAALSPPSQQQSKPSVEHVEKRGPADVIDQRKQEEFMARAADYSRLKKAINVAATSRDPDAVWRLVEDPEFHAAMIAAVVEETKDMYKNAKLSAHAIALLRCELEQQEILMMIGSARRNALEKRVAALEARPQAIAYGGVWRSGQPSKAGTMYSDRGSCWYCRSDSQDRPGESNDFVLAVKRGEDAR